MNTLIEDTWALHFDGKRFNGKERQAVVLKNESREIRLAVISLEDSRSETIASAIQKVLDEFDLWKAIKIIVTDTTNANTGHRNGAVVKLQHHFTSRHFPIPQYIGCQHHILDRILRLMMDEICGNATISPNISYNFVEEIKQKYDVLKRYFVQSSAHVTCPPLGWRDDMQFLLELGHCFRYYLRNGEFPFIHFRPLPPISNARWNSRGILAFLTFILLPHYREQLLPVCKFISGVWMDTWFSDHKFDPDAYQKLDKALQNYNKAKSCFQKHWCKQPFVINTQRREATSVPKEHCSICKN